jgi:hypothetical protein
MYDSYYSEEATAEEKIIINTDDGWPDGIFSWQLCIFAPLESCHL